MRCFLRENINPNTFPTMIYVIPDRIRGKKFTFLGKSAEICGKPCFSTWKPYFKKRTLGTYCFQKFRRAIYCLAIAFSKFLQNQFQLFNFQKFGKRNVQNFPILKSLFEIFQNFPSLKTFSKYPPGPSVVKYCSMSVVD